MSKLITLMSFTYPHEAQMLITNLEANGIQAIIKDEMTVQMNSFYSHALGGVKVLIDESDFAQAMEVLRAGGFIKSNDSTSDDKVQILQATDSTDYTVCPFCGSDNIWKKRKLSAWSIVLCFLLGALFPIFNNTNKCYDCEKEWKYQ